MIVITLMEENQNSASPYALAPHKLMNHTRTRQAVMYAPAWAVLGSQYWMTIAAADSSADSQHVSLHIVGNYSLGRVIAQEYQ